MASTEYHPTMLETRPHNLPATMRWEEGTFLPIPRWEIEPKVQIIEKLARQHLRIRPNEQCEVTFFSEGSFHKLYKITSSSSKEAYLMRISLPLCPTRSTKSEVATIRFIQQKTHIPTPLIVAYDDNAGNELKFEWILMELIPGQPLEEKWRTLSMEHKQGLVRTLAEYQSQLLRKVSRFNAIGSTFDVEPSKEELQESTPDSASPLLGSMVTMPFWHGPHVDPSAVRGPYQSCLALFNERLQVELDEVERILSSKTSTKDACEDAEVAHNLINRLRAALPALVPAGCDRVTETALYHWDLNDRNILVNDSGDITGIVDWESVNTVAIWEALGLPGVLETRNRSEAPVPEDYGDGDDECNGPKSQGKCDLYFEHLMEYECTHLRRVYQAELDRLHPEYISCKEQYVRMRDIDLAIYYVGSWPYFRYVRRWLDELDEGKASSLTAISEEPIC